MRRSSGGSSCFDGRGEQSSRDGANTVRALCNSSAEGACGPGTSLHSKISRSGIFETKAPAPYPHPPGAFATTRCRFAPVFASPGRCIAPESKRTSTIADEAMPWTSSLIGRARCDLEAPGHFTARHGKTSPPNASPAALASSWQAWTSTSLELLRSSSLGNSCFWPFATVRGMQQFGWNRGKRTHLGHRRSDQCHSSPLSVCGSQSSRRSTTRSGKSHARSVSSPCMTIETGPPVRHPTPPCRIRARKQTALNFSGNFLKWLP
jgi:hypothetical protein